MWNGLSGLDSLLPVFSEYKTVTVISHISLSAGKLFSFKLHNETLL